MRALKTYQLCWFLIIFMVFGQSLYANGGFRFKDNKKTKEVVKVQVINNLVIIPVEINGVQLSFLLDSGVNKPILFFLEETDSLQIKNTTKVLLKGLGSSESIEAIKSLNNTFRIGDIVNTDQEFYAVLNQDINLSPRLGIPVHGIIGYDLLKNFVVEISYVSERISFFKPENYRYKKCKRCEDFALEMEMNKPYVNSRVSMAGEQSKEVKLLIDSGASDALWLFSDEEEGIVAPEDKFRDFLGQGLGGSVFGERTKIDRFSIGDFDLSEVKAAFPDSSDIALARMVKGRNGSVGGEILKRFRVTFDYPNSRLRLKRNVNFKEPFRYNMSGIELQHNGVQVVREKTGSYGQPVTKESRGIIEIRLYDAYTYALKPSYVIANLRPDSPGAKAGLREGDVLIAINSRSVYNRSLQEIMTVLSEKEGKRMKLRVERNGIELLFEFVLRSPFKS